ncbi:MAG TPA: hypothetical protein VMV44_01535 [Rectinemataceae bacterium]|nr:hypothetical protein [Rectinemataceae bacterium]
MREAPIPAGLPASTGGSWASPTRASPTRAWPTPVLPSPESCDYAAYWCEENIARFLGRDDLKVEASWALLVSNASKTVAMLGQRAGAAPRGFVVWDYHVVALLILGANQAPLVFDFDSIHGSPLPAEDWISASFPSAAEPGLRPLFRLIPGRDYVEGLSSDRSHMLRPDGSWAAPPPPWPTFGLGRRNNLGEIIDMSIELPGAILDLEGLVDFCSGRGRGME